jgi:hypothetical protein
MSTLKNCPNNKEQWQQSQEVAENQVAYKLKSYSQISKMYFQISIKITWLSERTLLKMQQMKKELL